MRRVPYHQSVFDLLDIQPQESPQAREMIEAHEARNGRLPEAVRQWYLIERVVALRHDADWHARARNQRDHLWYDFTNMDWPEALESVLRQFAGEPNVLPGREEGRPAGVVQVMHENQGVCRWFVRPDGSDDPPVVVDEDYDYQANQVVCWVRVADSFSAFVFDWFARFYYEEWTPLSECGRDADSVLRSQADKPYRNGLWLYAPHAEALLPPHLDFLMEQFDEDYRHKVTGGATQYGFSDATGKIRVTTDDPGEEGGVSAWWLHADSAEHLYRLAERVMWCGNLREALRHHTEVAGTVMDRLRERG